MIFPDARCEGINQLVVEGGILSKVTETCYLTICEELFMLILQCLLLDNMILILSLLLVYHLCISTFIITLWVLITVHAHVVPLSLITLHEVYNINVCPVDIFDQSHIRVNSDSHSSVDTDSINTVTWLH